MAKKQIKYAWITSIIIIIAILVAISLNSMNPGIISCVAGTKSNLSQPRFIPGEIIVKFKSNVDRASSEAIIIAYGLESKFMTNFSGTQAFVVFVPVGSEPDWMCRFKVSNRELIEDVYPQYNDLNEEIENCIKGIGYSPANPSEERKSKVTPGFVWAPVYKNTTEEQAQAVLDKYELEGYPDWRGSSHSIMLDVPLGSESMWICQLKVYHKDIVSDAFPLYSTTVSD